METENTFGDADLDALVFGEAAEATPTPAANPTPSKQTWNAGGRTWDDAGKLAKAYDSLVRDYSKTKNKAKENEEWGKFGQWVNQNPDLRTGLQSKIEEYQKNKQQGMSTTAAARDAQLPREYVERIDKIEAAYADLLLDREIEALQRKYKVDDDTMQMVFKFAQENDGIALETAYKAVAYEKQMLEAKQAGQKGALAAFQKKKEANVGPSSNSNIAPVGTPGQRAKMSDRDHQAGLASKLEQFGFKD